MALPEDERKLFSHCNSPDLLNVVTAPLEACIVGDDWETLVEKLKNERDKGQDSDFAPWLNLLPTLDDFQGMPRFWTLDRMDFVSRFDSGQLRARIDVDRLRFNHDPWALAIVDSRSNFLPDKKYALTPMLDMFNHKSCVKTSARVDGGRRVVLQVAKDSILRPSAAKKEDWATQLLVMFGADSGGRPRYQKGTEVYVSYGSFDNMETLCNYGFVDENNEHNVETIRVRVRDEAPTYLVVTNQDGSIDNMINQRSLTKLRVAFASTEETETLEHNKWDGMGSISKDNDREIFGLIAGELEEALYDAKTGADEANNTEIGDTLAAAYLRGRQKTLEKGRDRLKAIYPDVF